MANPDIAKYGVAHRFQPGVSGNKKGRPKGSLSMSTIVKQLMDDEELADKMMARKPSYWEDLPDKNFASAIVVAMMAKAMGGDVKAATWLRVTGYGNKVVIEPDERPTRPISTIDLRTGKELRLVPDTK